MSGNGFYGKFCAIIEDKLGVDITTNNLDMGTQLHEGLNVDSLDFVELILEFEKVFGIIIPDSDVKWSEQMTLQDLMNLVQTKIGGELYVPDKPMTQALPVSVANPVVKQQQKFVLAKVNNTFEISDGVGIKKITSEQKGEYAQAVKLFAQLEQFYAQSVISVKPAPGKPVKPVSKTVPVVGGDKKTAEIKAKEEYEKASKLKNEINSKNKEIQK